MDLNLYLGAPSSSPPPSPASDLPLFSSPPRFHASNFSPPPSPPLPPASELPLFPSLPDLSVLERPSSPPYSLDASFFAPSLAERIRGRGRYEGDPSEAEITRKSAPRAREERGSSSSSTALLIFECNICLDLAKEPVVTPCGHLFCWLCIYQWLRVRCDRKECPVCKGGDIRESKLVPIHPTGVSAGTKEDLEDEDSRHPIPPVPLAQMLATSPLMIDQRFNGINSDESESPARGYVAFLPEHEDGGDRREDEPASSAARVIPEDEWPPESNGGRTGWTLELASKRMRLN